MSYSFPTFPLVNKIRITNPAASLDARYGPWPSALSALSAFNSGLREKGLTVGVDNGSGVVEYWFRDGVTDNDFIVKQVPLSATNISGGRAFTTTDDTNITLTLSGTSSSALLNAVVLSAGWTGQLGYSRGGTNASTAQEAINNLAGAVTNAQFLRGNGSNVVMSAIEASDVPTLNQNTTGSAATLTTTRTLWGQNFNGSQNVSGTLSAVGDIIGSSAITLSAGSGNNNINLRPSGSGLVTVTGNLSASNSITARDITATNLLSAASTFTRVLSVGDVQIRTVDTSNVFIGNSTTGRDAATGNHNFVFGLNAGCTLEQGSDNIFIGQSAGSKTNGGQFNNFLGRCAGTNNQVGGYNNFFGQMAGYSNTIGNDNNFFGQCAGYCNTNGGDNTFIGNSAGLINTGCRNNFIGRSAGCSNTSGANNNFLGFRAGVGNSAGSNNVIIGTCANVGSISLSGVIVLGNNAVATESHQIVLSTANVSFRNIGSTFEIGTPSLVDNLTVYGAVSSTGVVGTNTGFRINNGATSGHVLRGNGTNFVSSTLAASDIASGQALTKTNDTNVTLTLGGASSVALLSAASITAGWTGILAAGRGGTGNEFTQFSGPATSIKTFTLPNATAKILTDNAAVAISEGGTGQTTAQAAINALVSGPGASGTFLRSNGTNVVLTAIQVSDVPTLNQNTTGSAATLTTTRTLWGQNFNGSQNVSGTLTAVGDIIGSGAVTLSAANNNNLNLVATGTGNVVIDKADINGGTIDGTTIGLTTPASGVFTGVTVAGNVSIGGNLFVSGSATQINTTDLVVKDPIIFLAEGNLNDTVDIGFTAAYNHSLTPPRHTGLVRDNITKEWTLFSGLSTEILSAVQIPFDNPSLVVDTLVANIKGNVQGTLTGNVSGTANQANSLTTGRTISTTGDITYTSGSFNGTANVTGVATISSNVVSYSKIQQVGANKILGNPTGSTANVSEIDCTTSGRALLSATTVAAQRNNLGVGSAQSVTFGDVIVDNQTQTVLSKVYTGSANLSDTLNLLTVPDASYKTVKYTVQIKRTSDSSRCALEILATKNNATWTGTVYGIVDPAGLFADVDISVASGSVELAFAFGADNITYNVTAFAQAISD